MSLSSKVIMTVATALAGSELKRLVGKVELDDLLEPMGLERRRSHGSESFLLLSAGILIGGAAAVVFASTKRKDVISWLSAKAPNDPDEAGKPRADAVPVPSNQKVSASDVGNNEQQREGPDAVV